MLKFVISAPKIFAIFINIPKIFGALITKFIAAKHPDHGVKTGSKTAISVLCILGIVALGLACSNSHSKKGFTVAASSMPHSEILEFIKPDLKTQGIDLNILVVDDYTLPNRALANQEIDANFFQHVPFMEEQIRQFHYPLIPLATIEIEPMGLYSKKITMLGELKEGALIAIPNDPTNEGRALLLLQQQGLIELEDPQDLQATLLNISHNPKNLRFLEIDAAMIPRSLEDVEVAAINTNYALQAKLSPKEDALALEDPHSPYANVLVIRKGDEERADLQALKEAMTSEKMRSFILQRYKGAVLPAF